MTQPAIIITFGTNGNFILKPPEGEPGHAITVSPEELLQMCERLLRSRTTPPLKGAFVPLESYVPSDWLKLSGFGNGKIPKVERYTAKGRKEISLASLGLLHTTSQQEK